MNTFKLSLTLCFLSSIKATGTKSTDDDLVEVQLDSPTAYSSWPTDSGDSLPKELLEHKEKEHEDPKKEDEDEEESAEDTPVLSDEELIKQGREIAANMNQATLPKDTKVFKDQTKMLEELLDPGYLVALARLSKDAFRLLIQNYIRKGLIDNLKEVFGHVNVIGEKLFESAGDMLIGKADVLLALYETAISNKIRIEPISKQVALSFAKKEGKPVVLRIFMLGLSNMLKDEISFRNIVSIFAITIYERDLTSDNLLATLAKDRPRAGVFRKDYVKWVISELNNLQSRTEDTIRQALKIRLDYVLMTLSKSEFDAIFGNIKGKKIDPEITKMLDSTRPLVKSKEERDKIIQAMLEKRKDA